jgi:hypothetical protein
VLYDAQEQAKQALFKVLLAEPGGPTRTRIAYPTYSVQNYYYKSKLKVFWWYL